MLTIRLTRVGKKNSPSFRVVLTERQNPIKGKFIELLGHYNSRAKTHNLKKERILYWLGQGAKSSATIHNLLVSEKIIKGPKQKAWHAKKPAQSPTGSDNVAGKEVPKENKPAEPAKEKEKLKEEALAGEKKKDEKKVSVESSKDIQAGPPRPMNGQGEASKEPEK